MLPCVVGGELRVGETAVLGYIDQSRDALDANKTVWEEISDGEAEIRLGKRTVQSRAYCGRFNFRGTDQQQKVGQLSGGERNRVHLAKMRKSGANVLLLDEPTNDLDVDTLRALEDAILEFAGCAVVISHDRWFLDRIATHILAFEGDGRVVIQNAEGEVAATIGVDSDGYGYVETLNAEGEGVAAIGVDSEGDGIVATHNGRGRGGCHDGRRQRGRRPRRDRPRRWRSCPVRRR